MKDQPKTGKMHRGGMHVKSDKNGKDPMAHPTHHAANKECGMEKGFCPKDTDELRERDAEGENDSCY